MSNIFDDDYKAIQNAYDDMQSKEELNDLIETFITDFLAGEYDDPTPPSQRMPFDYSDSDSDAEADKKFNNQYNWLSERDPNSPEGIMKIWEWWIKKMANETNQPNLIIYADRVKPCQYDDGLWGVEPKDE